MMYYNKLVEKKSIVVDDDILTYVSDNEIYVKSDKPIIDGISKEPIEMPMRKDKFIHNYLWDKLVSMCIKEIRVVDYLDTL